VHPKVLKPDFFYWSWFSSTHLQITYVATLGFITQVDFDAIPVWFIEHIYFESGPALPSSHSLIYRNLFFWDIKIEICLQGNLGLVHLIRGATQKFPKFECRSLTT
jgi:hypothetical protein